MAELHFRSPLDDLNSQAQRQLWGKQIQKAPQCITLMAKCKLLLSKALLEGLDLSQWTRVLTQISLLYLTLANKSPDMNHF
jgi:hypothetical protein